MNLSILVVTYNCSMERSQTIHSLSTSKVGFDGVRLCIWNNGPKEIPVPTDTLAALGEKGFEVTIKQTPWNAPLSWIYNFFIEKNPADRYVILDHDSTLSEEYLQYIVENKDVFLGMPIVKIKGVPRYPLVRKKFSIGPYAKNDEIRTVGSGLLISQEAIDAVKNSYGNVFDENFALYEVDTSFVQRVQRIREDNQFKIIPSIEHSFSDFEEEKKEIKRFRRIERSYSFGLQLRHYPTRRAVLKLIKQTFKCLLGKNKVLMTKAVKAFIQGRHERCKQARLHTLIE
jgi:GT2 family glycosyltransferase